MDRSIYSKNHLTMRTILLTALLIIAGHVQAQFPFPTDNATWVNTMYTMVGPPPVPTWELTTAHNYCVNGTDTVINTIAYTKLERCTGGYKGAVREDAGRVYYVPGGEAQEYLLYDFTLEAGESAVVYYEPTTEPETGMTQEVTVSNVDVSALLGGRKLQYLQDGATWVEGIGPTWGLFTEPWTNVSNYRIEMECMSQADTVRFPEPALVSGSCALVMGVSKLGTNSLDLYPNPTTDGRVIVSGLETEGALRITVTSSDGRIVLTELAARKDRVTLDLGSLPSGMYFVEVLGERERYRAKVLRQ
jgi:hypothetical protein